MSQTSAPSVTASARVNQSYMPTVATAAAAAAKLAPSTSSSYSVTDNAAAATAAVAALSCGFSVTDPRIQPFLKLAREDHVRTHARVLVSNGIEESVAFEQAERSASDRSQFFGQAILKYFANLTDSNNNGSSEDVSVSLSPVKKSSLTTQTPSSSWFQEVVPAGVSDTVSTTETMLTKQVQAPIFEAQSGFVSSTTTSINADTPITTSSADIAHQDGVAKVMANIKFNLNKTRSSRFDVPAAVTAPPQTPSLHILAPLFNAPTTQLASIQQQVSQATATHKPKRLSGGPTLQYVDRALKQWTYRVFSTLQVPPAHMDLKEWRQHISSFVNLHVAQVRHAWASEQPLPTWLSTYTVPSVSEILGHSLDSFAVSGAAAPPPPPPPEDMSPVSSSSPEKIQRVGKRSFMLARATSRGYLKNRQAQKERRQESPSSSSMSSSSSSSPAPVAVTRLQRRQQKNTALWTAAKQAAKKISTKKPIKKRALEVVNAVATVATSPYVVSTLTAEELRRREERVKRFGFSEPVSNNITFPSLTNLDPEASEEDPSSTRLLTWQEKLALLTSTKPVIGKSVNLEKAYLRLCGAPDPALVRPEEVLKQSFDHCMKKYESDPNNYRFIEEQFKSIRQDLAVQRLRNNFTIQVYETNARVALENLDLGQFNQCQTQLRELYRHPSNSNENQIEFLCYHLLYLVLTNMKQECIKVLGQLTQEQLREPPIIFALTFRKALNENNFRRVLFFSQGYTPPFLCSYLIRIFLERIRVTYLCLIAKAHYQANVTFLKRELFFGTESECRLFLINNKAVWADPHGCNVIDCRRSSPFFELSPLLHTQKMKALG